jgi:hypothetical protein
LFTPFAIVKRRLSALSSMFLERSKCHISRRAPLLWRANFHLRFLGQRPHLPLQTPCVCNVHASTTHSKTPFKQPTLLYADKSGDAQSHALVHVQALQEARCTQLPQINCSHQVDQHVSQLDEATIVENSGSFVVEPRSCSILSISHISLWYTPVFNTNFTLQGSPLKPHESHSRRLQ